MDNLQEYLTKGVKNIVGDAIKASLSNPKESIFMASFAAAAAKANSRRDRYERDGIHIPPFLICSITSKCNLHCVGCYARENHMCNDNAAVNPMAQADWERIFSEAEQLGISFILLAGGEPLLREDVIGTAAKFPKILFPIFTNGTMLDKDYIAEFDKHRNLIPILSMEGGRKKTDDRRGDGVYDRLENAMSALRKNGIFFGMSITMTTENIFEILSDEYISNLKSKGIKVAIFVEYVPVTPESEQLAPTEKERIFAAERLSEIKHRHENMLFIDFPGDELASGGCLAAGRGFIHINPDGNAEPCPFSPYSDTNLRETPLVEALNSPLLKKLRDSTCLEESHSGGCVLFEKDAEVKRIVGK